MNYLNRILSIRHFSFQPVKEVYDSLKATEHLIEKYQLHRTRDPKFIKDLMQREEISREMGIKMLDLLEHSLAAESNR